MANDTIALGVEHPRNPDEMILTVVSVETSRETDGRWIAEVPELPGVLAYGASEQEARNCVRELALSVFKEKVTGGRC